MKHTHLTDDQLISTCVDRAEPARDTGCTACNERQAEVAGLLDEIRIASADDFDRAFPPSRLARQSARILQRLEQQGRLGRVIAFPLAQSQRGSLLRPSHVRRWVAGAAAAGLLIGVAAGHLVHELPAFSRPVAASQQQAVYAPRPSSLQHRPPAVTSSEDDDFLAEIERAVGSPAPAALRRIDLVMPVTWEVP